MKKKRKADSHSTGIVSGLIFPLLFLIAIILVKKSDYSFFEYLGMTLKVAVLPKIISLCLVPNLILFFLFLRLNMLKAGKGVIMSMFISGLVIVILKII